MEQMTVYKALIELKLLNKRIESSMTERFCTTKLGSANKVNGKDINFVKKEYEANFQRCKDLIDRYNRIKSAINLSNAKTVVKIFDKEYTIAELIYLSQFGLDKARDLVTALTKNYNECMSKIESRERELDKKADEYIKNLYGTKETNINSSTINDQRNSYIEANRIELVEGFDVNNAIVNIKDEIAKFEAEIDSAISISNATTIIEF